MLQHYVVIRYEEGVSHEHIEEFCRRMLALRSLVDGIDYLSIGRDILHDPRSWDLILIMRFSSVAALRIYQQHPEHQNVMAFNQPFVAAVASVDFET